MDKIINGILYRDGKKTFILGESYYPSFHPCKFPVMPELDRIAEMKKDLRMMKEAGFNHVRFAALGDVSYNAEKDEITYNGEFVDSMTEEANKNGLTVSLRLQGFSVNLHGYTDSEIIDEKGNVPQYEWCDFVRSTPTHPGILEDNFRFAEKMAGHFSGFDNVIAYQIYNEPKFPKPMHIICDYSKYSIAAYRKWLADNGIMTPAEAESYEPPHSRSEQSPEMWAYWRYFCSETMNDFLKNAAEGSKAGAELPTYTCLTSDTSCKTNALRGVDAFRNAKDMDIVGYTTYKHALGAEYYLMCLEGDIFVCAANSEHKESWCIELDSRTYIPPFVYNRGTYATLGSGVKGIVYYQWRGDCPVPGVPYPNSCGILNFDGTKTDNFENAVNVNRYIAGLNDILTGARRANDGIAMFCSKYAMAYQDAVENSAVTEGLYNAYSVYFLQYYTDLRRAGYTVSFTDADHLNTSAGIKVLIVTSWEAISLNEKNAVLEFISNGGQVFVGTPLGDKSRSFPGLRRYRETPPSYKENVFLPRFTPEDLPEITGIIPVARAISPNLGVQVLEGEGYVLLVLTVFSSTGSATDAKVQVNIPFDSIEFSSVEGEREVFIDGDTLTVKNISEGGILILKTSQSN